MSLDRTRDARIEQLAREDWGAAASGPWQNAEMLWRHLCENTNIVAAARGFPWDSVLVNGSSVLDLGCGSGWLSGLLSDNAKVREITACDSSMLLLSDVLPSMVRLVGGHPERISSVCAFFTPIPAVDSSFDLVVMSSAFHHAPDRGALLNEVRRVLRPGGALVLLNETPWHAASILKFTTRIWLTSLARLAGSKRSRGGSIAADHVIYDERLGDRAWTMGEWVALTRRWGWSMSVIDSAMCSYPEHVRPASPLEPKLTHFVLRPTVAASD